MSTYDAGRVRNPLDVRGHLLGHQGLHLDRHALPAAQIALQHAAALFLRLSVPVRVRRDDRRGGGDAVAGRALARHLLRGRALSLHHGGRQRDGVPGRRALLVPQDVRAPLLRAGGACSRPPRCSWGSCSPSCRSSCWGTRGCRAATTPTRRSFSGCTCCRRAGAYLLGGARAPDARQPGGRAQVGRQGARQPLELARLRVADPLAAAQAQLRGARRSSTTAPTTTPSPRRRPVPAPDNTRVQLGEQYDRPRDAGAEPASSGCGCSWPREILLFAALFALYAAYRSMFPPDFKAGIEHNTLAFGTVNMYVLLTSSLLAALASRRSAPIGARAASRLLAGTAVLGVAFLRDQAATSTRKHWHEGSLPGPLLPLRRAAHLRRQPLLHHVLGDDRLSRAARHGRRRASSTWMAVRAWRALYTPDGARAAGDGDALLAPGRRHLDLPLAAPLPELITMTTHGSASAPSIASGLSGAAGVWRRCRCCSARTLHWYWGDVALSLSIAAVQDLSGPLVLHGPRGPALPGAAGDRRGGRCWCCCWSRCPPTDVATRRVMPRGPSPEPSEGFFVH